MNDLSVSQAAQPPSLPAFANAAQRGQDIFVVPINDSQPPVLGLGNLQGNSNTGPAQDIDTTSIFVKAIALVYGDKIAGAVARELGLGASPGTPLSARTVLSALQMAAAASDALAGVDFFTRLSASASGDTGLFQQTCRATGIDPARVPPEQRRALDRAMQARFDEARAKGQVPVAPTTVQAWLAELLRKR